MLPAAPEGTGGGTVSPDITAVGAASLWPGDLEDEAGRAAASDVSSNGRRKSQAGRGPWLYEEGAEGAGLRAQDTLPGGSRNC